MRKQLSPPKGDFISSCNLWRSINPAPGVTAFAHAKLGGSGCCADQTAQEIFNTVKESFMWCAETWLALSWFASIHERTLRDTSLKVCMHWWRWSLLDDEKTFHHQQLIIHEDVAHLLEWSTCLSMFAPTTRNGSTAIQINFIIDENIFINTKKYLVTQKIIYDTTWSCCNSNMSMLGGDRGSWFWTLASKKDPLYI
jgi:hypothetical protein